MCNDTLSFRLTNQKVDHISFGGHTSMSLCENIKNLFNGSLAAHGTSMLLLVYKRLFKISLKI